MAFNLTNELLARLGPPKPPPEGFIALTATNDVLISHGLPPRPDKEVCPQQYAQWERLMSRPLNFIPSEAVVVPRADPPVTAEIHGGKAMAREQSQTWSGAVNEMLKCGDKFVHIEATWTVPGVYPPPDKWKSAETWDKPGDHYACGIWVGIDGHHTSHDILQAGTGLRCKVNGNGKLEQRSYAWFEWFPEDQLELTKFKVKAGDVITVIVDYLGLKATNSNTVRGRAVYINESNSTYTPYDHEYTASSSVKEFKGDTAEWILEGHKGSLKTPNFGATFMYNCLAVTAQGGERNLECSKLIDMVRDKVRLSTPVKVTENILGIYYGEGKSLAHLVDNKVDSGSADF